MCTSCLWYTGVSGAGDGLLRNADEETAFGLCFYTVQTCQRCILAGALEGAIMELQGLLFPCTFFVVVASCKQQEQNVTDLQRIKPQIFRPHTLLFLLLSLLLFSA